MKTRITCCTSAFTVALYAAVLLLSPRPAQAIVNGVLDGNGHPNVGAIVVDADAAEQLDVWRVECSGTLIHPRIFLTAGHCTEPLEQRLAEGALTLDDVHISFGANALDPKSWHEISAVITHPDYDVEQNNGNGAVPMSDVGVIILKRPVRKIQPAVLAEQGLLDFLLEFGLLPAHPDGAPLVVVGYGLTESPDIMIDPPDGLRRVAVSEFQNLIGEWLFLSQNFSQGEGGTSFGDSGGPTFWIDPLTGEEILVGITSRGDFGPAALSVAARTDTPQSLDFIEAVIEMVEAGEL